MYNSVVRKRSWSLYGDKPLVTSKAGLHPKKILLSVWWYGKGELYYKLLQNNQMINSDKYS